VGGTTVSVKKHVYDTESGLHPCNGKCVRGRGFIEATKKGSEGSLKIDKMAFGYIGPNHGRFCRFLLRYYPKADTVQVLLQPANQHTCVKHPNGYTDD